MDVHVCMHACMHHGWMDGRTDGGMEGWMEGWMDGWMDCMIVMNGAYIHHMHDESDVTWHDVVSYNVLRCGLP